MAGTDRAQIISILHELLRDQRLQGGSGYYYPDVFKVLLQLGDERGMQLAAETLRTKPELRQSSGRSAMFAEAMGIQSNPGIGAATAEVNALPAAQPIEPAATRREPAEAAAAPAQRQQTGLQVPLPAAQRQPLIPRRDPAPQRSEPSPASGPAQPEKHEHGAIEVDDVGAIETTHSSAHSRLREAVGRLPNGI